MTRPQPPSRNPSPGSDRQLARDIARQLDRRRGRRRVVVWLAVLALVALAALYVRFGSGLGLGSAGQGIADLVDGDAPRADTEPRRCAVRLTRSGITVDGTPMPRDEAVAACKATKRAAVTVTGDAPHGERVDLLDALKAGGVDDIILHEPARTSGSN